MDIGSKSKWPSRQLSNFALSPFIVDGVSCASMEGFIQALKRKSHDIQIHGCTLVGIGAKRWGSGPKWWNRPPEKQLWWKGQGFPAHGRTHLELIELALRAKFTQHSGSKRALLATGDAKLTHSIGRNSNTSLKKSDFCRLLMQIRTELQKEDQ